MKSYQEEADKVATIQREAGWDELSIYLYAQEQRAFCCDDQGFLLPGIICLGAGLAQDNSRFGVIR
jgi:hypothetical protein